MHGQGMIHGDLKGVRLRMLVTALSPNVLFITIKANIMIDKDRHARLTDFGLLTITSDPTNFTAPSPHVTGGTTRWMSPEILDPDRFGFKDSRPTKESDCYALGMVVLEVLSGRPPFTPDNKFVVMRKVPDGERPGRPEGPERAWFTDDLWGMLQRCWAARSDSRPSIGAVLECLERASGTWEAPSQWMGEDAKAKKQERIRLAELKWLRLEAEESAGRAEMERHILEVERMWALEEEERLCREEEERLCREVEERLRREEKRVRKEEEERFRREEFEQEEFRMEEFQREEFKQEQFRREEEERFQREEEEQFRREEFEQELRLLPSRR